jgi:hypothetical protein
LVKTSAVVGARLASTVAALFTSRFGVAGTVIGAALTTMIITAGSALFGVYLERAAARARGIPSVVRGRPPRRRPILLGAILAAAASFVWAWAPSPAWSLGWARASRAGCGTSAPPRMTVEEGRLRRALRKHALRSSGAARRASLPPPNRAAAGNPSKPRPPASKGFPTPQAPLEGGPAAWYPNPATRPGTASLPKKRPAVGSPRRSVQEPPHPTGKRPTSSRAQRPAAPGGPSRPTMAPRTDPPRGSNRRGRRRGCTSNAPRDGQLLPQAPALSLALFAQRRGRSVLGRSHPESCIAPVLLRQNRRGGPCYRAGTRHLVTPVDRYTGSRVAPAR